MVTKKMNYLSILEKDFDVVDRNKNGWLSKREVHDCLLAFGFDPHYTEEFMLNFDINNDNKITKREFLEAAKQIKIEKITEAQMRSVFRSADKNQSGKIDAYELRDFLKKQKNVVSMDLCTKWIKENDKNGDKKLDYEEFLKFVQSKL
ncbi:hypothetical protein MN116_001275 [Schistosoma mekongi]|uniref:EF-hand domain-containing protein n=1 Tax=Schistosoma mekongi TaxID=38744 RepID=A0AAE1ZKP1_SCHME|nr:hypothetical protein MN116_001275 [Schistosoma mekongi]